MAFVLSRTEVDALLPQRRGAAAVAATQIAGAEGVGAGGSGVGWDSATLERLEMVLEAVAQRLAESLGQRVADTVAVEYLGLAPGAQLDSAVAPGVGSWVLKGLRRCESGRIAVETSLVFALIDSLLGGPRGVIDESRCLTGLERSLLTRTIELFAATLSELASVGVQVDDRVGRLELGVHATASGSERPGQKTQRAAPGGQAGQGGQVVEPGTVLAGYELSVGATRGLLHVEFSGGLVERLATVVGTAEEREPGGPEETATAERRLTARLSQPRLSEEQLEGLAVGDVIVTGHAGDGAWEVLLDGVVRFGGEPGAIGGRRAVVLAEAADSAGVQNREDS